MAKFLTTMQISGALLELIQDADKTLYLISPYLKLSRDFQEILNSRNQAEKKTIIIYGKYELSPEQLKFLTSLRHVYLKFHENLHAKCYVNDTKLILTSMNFYEYSMINNKEMGVLYDTTHPEDQEIYSKAMDYIKHIEINSNDKPFELAGTVTVSTDKKVDVASSKSIPPKSDIKKESSKPTGYCIRSGVEIPFNITRPLSNDAYNSWSKYGDPEYAEKYCHFTGEASYGETCYSRPIMKKNWKKAKEIFTL